MYIKVLTVSALNNYLKKIVDSDFILNNSSIKGEISNFKIHTSGHIYFSLKDEKSKINCVMFRSQAEFLTFMPKDGMKVIVNGRVSVYEKEGSYQLYCNEIKPEGVGELHAAFQKLKEKLEKEGLFDEAHKKPIPIYAKNIGIVTSPTGAAIRDIINIANRRNDKVNLIIFPAQVQGVSAPSEIIKGIEFFNNKEDIDLIILARGGGSLEELWAFNDEKLAYSIYSSKKPIITGIGHEIDFSIADFVSDRRAPTPSAAAEIAVFDKYEFCDKTFMYKNKLRLMISSYLTQKRNRLDIYNSSLRFHNPSSYIKNQYIQIDIIRDKIDNNIKTKIFNYKEKLRSQNTIISAHNPLNILNKGYALLKNEDDELIRSIEVLKKCNRINVRLKDGEATINIRKGNENGDEKGK